MSDFDLLNDLPFCPQSSTLEIANGRAYPGSSQSIEKDDVAKNSALRFN